MYKINNYSQDSRQKSYKPSDPALRMYRRQRVSEHILMNVKSGADKSLWLKLLVKVANGWRPSPACSPRNAFRNFMLIWLVTLDQRQARQAREAWLRRRVGQIRYMTRDTWRRQWQRRRFGLSTPLPVHCPRHAATSSIVGSVSRLTGKRQNG